MSPHATGAGGKMQHRRKTLLTPRSCATPLQHIGSSVEDFRTHINALRIR